MTIGSSNIDLSDCTKAHKVFKFLHISTDPTEQFMRKHINYASTIIYLYFEIHVFPKKIPLKKTQIQLKYLNLLNTRSTF